MTTPPQRRLAAPQRDDISAATSSVSVNGGCSDGGGGGGNPLSGRRGRRSLRPSSPRLLLLLLFGLAAAAVAGAAAAPLPQLPQQQTQQTPNLQQQALTCADADGAGGSFCTLTPGYKLRPPSSVADPTLLTTTNCCERDDSRSAFATCDSAAGGGAGAGAAQAPTEADGSWVFQDAAATPQALDRFTGLCFSVRVSPSNCADHGDPLAAPKCCTKKPPSVLQFKIATPDAPSVKAGSRRHATLASLAKCGLSWAPGGARTTRALRRINKWEQVAAGDHAQYFNVPTAFPSKARQATFCLYTNGAADGAVDCSWESICGLKDGSAPMDYGAVPFGEGAAENEYAQGCEVRLVGRRSAATSQCCSPPMALVSFDPEDGGADDDGGGAAAKKVAGAAAAAAAPSKRAAAAVVALRRG
jgi:hypothetical protein